MTDRPKVFIARLIPDDGIDPVVAACDARVWDGDLPPPRAALLDAIRGCDGVLTLLTDKVDDEFLDAAGPQLKVVSNYAVGFDNVDVPACTARGVAVGNTPGVLTETTADLAWALLMAAARRLPEGDRYVRDGKWKTWGPLLLLGPDVHGATIGIVGFGRIGQAVARRATGFGMTILYWSRSRAERSLERELGASWVELEDLLAQADFVIIKVASRAMTVEIEGVIWYHVVRPFSPRWEKTQEGGTPGGVCCPFTVDMVWSFFLCVSTPAFWWRSYPTHG